MKPWIPSVAKLASVGVFEHFAKREDRSDSKGDMGLLYRLIVASVIDIRLRDMSSNRPLEYLSNVLSGIPVRNCKYSLYLFSLLKSIANQIDKIVPEDDSLEIGSRAVQLFDFEVRIRDDERNIPDYLVPIGQEIVEICDKLKKRMTARLEEGNDSVRHHEHPLQLTLSFPSST